MSSVKRWQEAFLRDPDAAEVELRAAAEKAGGPLRAAATDASHVELGFVWFGPAETVSLSCQLLGLVPAPMHRLGDRPVWMLTVEAPADVAVPYQFVIDDPLHGLDVAALMQLLADDQAGYLQALAEQQERRRSDPANPSRLAPQAALMSGGDPAAVPVDRWESVLDLVPGRPTASDARPDGTRWSGTLSSTVLDNERTVAVRRTDHRAGDEANRWLLVALDGDLVDGPWGLLDAVHEHSGAGDLPPITSVAVHNADLAARAVEMVGRDEVATMLSEELPRWLDDHGIVVPAPARTIVAGISATGLAAAHAAIEHPEVYGNVLSCSGGFIAGDPDEAGRWYGLGARGEPEWLTRRLAVEPVRPVRFWLDAGLLERDPMPQTPGLSILAANRHLRTVLTARGYDVALHEFPGGHDLAHWQRTFVLGVRHLTRPSR